MAFSFQEPKTVSQWVDYLNDSGEKQGRIKIRGIAYPKYQVELDRLSTIYLREKRCIEFNGVELTHNQAIFSIVAQHLVEDWDGVAIEFEGEITEVPYTAEIAFNIMRWGKDLAGASLAGWVIGKATSIQADADAFKADVVGKSESSTNGQDLATKQAKKPKKTTTSTNG